MPSRLGKFRRLAPRDRQLFVRAWLYLLAADAALRLRPFPDVQSAAQKLRKGDPSSEESTAEKVRRAKTAVRRAAKHHLARTLCLQQSLTLQRLLADEGVATELKIGVRKEGDSISAHAWVECNGLPLGEPKNVGARFAPVVAAGNREP